MGDSHAFASLSPSLLARKGGAKPAMRRQDSSRFVPGAQVVQPEDLGWNDWGSADEPAETEPPAVSAASAPVAGASSAPALALEEAGTRVAGGEMPEVLRQIEQLAWRVNQAVASVPAPASLPEGRRAAFTLRLDSERHFRLKMAGVVLNRSAQVLVTEALDKYLSEIPEVASLKSAGREPG